MNLAVILSSLAITLSFAFLPASKPQTNSSKQAVTKVAVDSGFDWHTMSHADKKDYMRETVLPKMQKIFSAYNKEEYGDLKCKTCHGDGARTGEFKMPNPKLGKLPKSKEGMKALAAQSPAMMKFMTDKVKPEMAALLGMDAKDSKTKFGCGNCHMTTK